jgi:tRNA pseudouridine38-40 synthase
MQLIKKISHISYDGSEYRGFSISIGKKTIQQRIEETLSKIFDDPSIPSHIEFCSRTDAGVHAIDQLITFFVPNYFDNYKLLLILNQRLPCDIRIQSISSVNDSYNLRDKIKSKVYQYIISNDKKNPFINRYAWTISRLPDFKQLNLFLKVMEGKHDFSLLAKECKRYSTTICEIFKIVTYQKSISELIIEIEGDRFLYNMVRRIIGFTVFLTLKQKTVPSTFEELIDQYQSQTNMRAPACGLFLYKVILFDDS